MAAKREIFLLRNRQAARKCREKKKALVADLLKSAEFFSINNAKIPYVIEQIILELNDLSAMAVSTTEFAPTVARNSSPGLTKGYSPAIRQSCCFHLSHRRVSCASSSGLRTTQPGNCRYVCTNRSKIVASRLTVLLL
jgi:hypothetical protein